MFKAVLIDDEQHCIDRVRCLLKTYSDDVSIVGTYTNVEEAVKGIAMRRPDLVFLDVQLGENDTGFDVLEKIGSISFDVVFITAYDQYAVQAFRFAALDYLLKPIDIDEFTSTMDRFFRQVGQQQLPQKLATLLANLSHKGQPKKIGLPTAEGYEFLDVSEIVHCQSDINYTNIYTTSGRKYTVSKTLKYVEELLSGHHFFRIHHSHLINLGYVTKYSRGKGGYVTLAGNIVLEVSLRRKDEFLERLRMK